MTAAVVPFTGKQVGPVFDRSPAQQRIDVRAMRDARLINDAWNRGRSWQDAAIMALVKVLDKNQRLALLGILDVRAIAADDQAAEQAAAVFRFQFGKPEEIARVATLLVKMNGRAL